MTLVVPPTQPKLSKKAALRRVGAAVVVSLSCFGVYHAVAATATIPIIAKLIRAIEVTVNTAMNFGTLAVLNDDDAGGSARLDPATGQLTVDSSGGLAAAGGVPKVGRLTIRGAPLPVNVTIAMPTMQIDNGAEFLTVRHFKMIDENGGSHATVTPSGPGNSIAVTLGATVETRPGSATGTYTGANTIFANYQ